MNDNTGLHAGDCRWVMGLIFDCDTFAHQYMGLFRLRPERKLPQPMEDCGICRFPLNENDMGDPHALPCDHVCLDYSQRLALGNRAIGPLG